MKYAIDILQLGVLWTHFFCPTSSTKRDTGLFWENSGEVGPIAWEVSWREQFVQNLRECQEGRNASTGRIFSTVLCEGPKQMQGKWGQHVRKECKPKLARPSGSFWGICLGRDITLGGGPHADTYCPTVALITGWKYGNTNSSETRKRKRAWESHLQNIYNLRAL